MPSLVLFRSAPRLGWLVAAAAIAALAAQLVAAAHRAEPPAKHPVCLFSAGAEDDPPEPAGAGLRPEGEP